jgi:hypothetical protein
MNQLTVVLLGNQPCEEVIHDRKRIRIRPSGLYLDLERERMADNTTGTLARTQEILHVLATRTELPHVVPKNSACIGVRHCHPIATDIFVSRSYTYTNPVNSITADIPATTTGTT